MPAPSIESFCERCGTKYTFEPPQQRGKRLKGLGRTLGLLAENAEPEAVGLVASRDPFHGTFHFCLDCRQYTCPNCWNEIAGFCQGCVPLPESPDLGGAEAFAALEAETALADAAAEHRLMGQVEAWPGVDLPQPELEPEPIMVVAPEPELPYAAEPDLPVELVYEPAPVEAEGATVNAQLTRTLAELDHVEAEPVAEPEPVAAASEQLAEAEFVAAPIEHETAPQPIAAEAEPQPIAAEAEPQPIAAEAEPQPIAAEAEPQPIAAEAEPEPVAATATEEAAEGIARAEPLPLAAAVTDGVVEPDGLFERAWDVLYTLPATAEFAETAPSAGDWASLASALPVQAAPEPVVGAEPELVTEPDPIAAVELAAEPVAIVEPVALAEPEPVVAEPEVVFTPAPAFVAEPVALAEPEPVVAEPEVVFTPAPAFVAEPVALAEPEPVAAEPVVAPEVVAQPALVVEPVAAAPPAPVVMPQPVAAAAEPVAPLPVYVPQPVTAIPQPIFEPRPIAPAPPPAMPIAAAPQPVAPQAPIHMPTIVEPARPIEPHLAPGWRMTAPDEPSSVWPPHAPVYRPPTPAQPQTPIHQQANGGNQHAAHAGAHAASGIRPCYNCSLPVSASARFCRRCGSAQQTTGI